MLRRMALVRNDVSKGCVDSIIGVRRIGEVGTLEVASNWSTLRRNTNYMEKINATDLRTRTSVASCILCCSYFTDSRHPDEGGARFLRNVGSYKSHTT
jgi:hypothetical protein